MNWMRTLGYVVIFSAGLLAGINLAMLLPSATYEYSVWKVAACIAVAVYYAILNEWNRDDG